MADDEGPVIPTPDNMLVFETEPEPLLFLPDGNYLIDRREIGFLAEWHE